MEINEYEEQIAALRLQVGELTEIANQFGLNWNRGLIKDTEQSPVTNVGLVNPVTVGKASDSPCHALIQGDNLEALFALQTAGFNSSVDLIYIDPPYNTGNNKRTGFSYTDRFRSPQDVERHSSWLSMMDLRLKAALPLLKPTGVILISIDDNEVHHLRVLCDTIFGEHNFIAQLVWDGGTVKNNAKLISTTHEYVLVYARSFSALKDCNITWRQPRPGAEKLIAKYEELCKQHKDDYTTISDGLKKWVKTSDLSTRLKVFTSVDARGVFTYADLSAPGANGGTYDVLHPATGKPCQVPSRGWGYTQEKMDSLISEDRVLFGVDETFQPMRKLYLQEKMDQVCKSVLNYPARTSTHLLEHMLGERNTFNNPKNLDMLSDLIRLVAPSDAVVLDFFAGSGTTGHAVLNLNAADGGTRSFILGTNNEHDICDKVTFPRLQAAITGVWANGSKHSPLGGQLVKFDTTSLRAAVGKDSEKDMKIDALAGLVSLRAGASATLHTFTVSAVGPTQAVFGWTGQGRVSDVKRSWQRFISAHPMSLFFLPAGTDVATLGVDLDKVVFI